jgi:hypothetical protein
MDDFLDTGCWKGEAESGVSGVIISGNSVGVGVGLRIMG